MIRIVVVAPLVVFLAWAAPAAAQPARSSDAVADELEDEPLDDAAAPVPQARELATGTQPPVPTGGSAVVDNAASAEREREFRKAPWAGEVFIRQWSYREPRLPTVPTSAPDEPIARLSVNEAVHEALLHNPGIAAERLNPLRAREGTKQIEGQFDPSLGFFFGKDYLSAPNASALGGAADLNRRNVDGNAFARKLLRTGGDFRIDFLNNRFVTNARFQGLVPQYTPELLFSLNQPLLRNFGYDFAYLSVNVAQLNSDAARFIYRAQLANFVKRVIEVYWAVVFARENLRVQEQSLELARATLRENEERVRVGLLAPVVVKEAESQAALREEQVIVAANTLDNARRVLRQIVFLQPGPGRWPREVDPVELPSTVPVEVDQEGAFAIATEKRPELQARNYDLEAKNLTKRIQENQLLPRLDFVGGFGLNGLSGNEVPVTFNDQTVISSFGGDYWKGLDRMTSGDYYSYTAGVEFEIPIGNATAKAQYAQAKIDVSQAELNRRQLISDIAVEVQNAVSNVLANMKRIQSSRLARELAEENLRNQQKRLEVGLVTTKDVLDFQDDLTQARGLEVQAATDYNVSLAELARAQGTLLDRYSVVIEEPGTRHVPWWARF